MSEPNTFFKVSLDMAKHSVVLFAFTVNDLTPLVYNAYSPKDSPALKFLINLLPS